MNALQAGNVRNHLTVIPGNEAEGLSTLSARSNQYLGRQRSIRTSNPPRSEARWERKMWHRTLRQSRKDRKFDPRRPLLCFVLPEPTTNQTRGSKSCQLFSSVIASLTATAIENQKRKTRWSDQIEVCFAAVSTATTELRLAAQSEKNASK